MPGVLQGVRSGNKNHGYNPKSGSRLRFKSFWRSASYSLKEYLGLLRESLRPIVVMMVLYSSWLCHNSSLNIKCDLLCFIRERVKDTYKTKGRFRWHYQRKRPHIQGICQAVFEKIRNIFREQEVI